jgi:ABC-type dipeptide/oligopeptide/nickel transport system ATPase component
MPQPAATASGCSFAPRCAFRQDRCLDEAPALRLLGAGHAVACHRAEHVIAQPVLVTTSAASPVD